MMCGTANCNKLNSTWSEWLYRIVLETEGSVIAEKVSAHGIEGATSLAEQVSFSHDLTKGSCSV